MGISNLCEEAVLLNVDLRRHESERIELMLRENGFTGKYSSFVVGKCKLLPENEYDLIDLETPSQLWKNGLYARLENSYHAFRAFQHIIYRLKEKGTESVLILEDDCNFTNNFMDVVDSAEKEIYDKSLFYDVLYLGANHTWSPTEELSPHLLRLNGSLCWHSVILDYQVFDTILSWTPDKPIDLRAAEELHTNFRCLAVWPNISLQLPGYSNVEGKIRDYTEFFSSKGSNH
jgi:hypothetical protein